MVLLDRLAEDADLHCPVDSIGRRLSGLALPIAGLKNSRLVRLRLHRLHLPLVDDARDDVGVHGLDPAGVDISDLEEGVGLTAGSTLAVEDLTNPPLGPMGLDQDAIANLDLKEQRIRSHRKRASTDVLARGVKLAMRTCASGA